MAKLGPGTNWGNWDLGQFGEMRIWPNGDPRDSPRLGGCQRNSAARGTQTGVTPKGELLRTPASTLLSRFLMSDYLSELHQDDYMCEIQRICYAMEMDDCTLPLLTLHSFYSRPTGRRGGSRITLEHFHTLMPRLSMPPACSLRPATQRPANQRPATQRPATRRPATCCLRPSE